VRPASESLLLVRYQPLKIQFYLPLTPPPPPATGGRAKGKEKTNILPPDN